MAAVRLQFHGRLRTSAAVHRLGSSVGGSKCRRVRLRIQNTGSVRLMFVEVQHGDYFGEDDIIRLDDDYGRLEAQAPSAD